MTFIAYVLLCPVDMNITALIMKDYSWFYDFMGLACLPTSSCSKFHCVIWISNVEVVFITVNGRVCEILLCQSLFMTHAMINLHEGIT